ncbi:hypothetical protein ROZALSC1DRAFT_27552 [Rozella allomycis CSF55]|uniref:Uncharacterized protein n=1 Tax=Rozella allomycis (strain CSF55) TaxID=988480 RepID=A0A075AZR2_ROZAC|nr:hypothetical protein O9G_005259 [Rozella allomycis CSF55]RKP21004.1 hypothetical protein ROZALSC1DRAFT_27552 [Rozella allomycis CSF55]|eukprot:EPZ34177.1 hypothetical protein O9G_005259 [Rozella allomycis CSF55]
MKQLLIWAAQCASEKDSTRSKHKEKTIKAIIEGEISCNWLERPAVQSSVIVQPNPVNMTTTKTVELYEKVQNRLMKEKDQWEHMVTRVEKRLSMVARNFEEQEFNFKLNSEESQEAKKILSDISNPDFIAALFEKIIRDYCEILFKSIFKEYFHEDQNKDPQKEREILEILRVLSKK